MRVEQLEGHGLVSEGEKEEKGVGEHSGEGEQREAKYVAAVGLARIQNNSWWCRVVAGFQNDFVCRDVNDHIGPRNV